MIDGFNPDDIPSSLPEDLQQFVEGGIRENNVEKLRGAAATMRTQFTTLTEAGFTEDQALVLLVETLRIAAHQRLQLITLYRRHQ